MAESKIGAEMTQAMVVSLTPNSTAIELKVTVRIVMGKVVANMPVSVAINTQVGYVPRSSSRATTPSRRLFSAMGRGVGASGEFMGWITWFSYAQGRAMEFKSLLVPRFQTR